MPIGASDTVGTKTCNFWPISVYIPKMIQDMPRSCYVKLISYYIMVSIPMTLTELYRSIYLVEIFPGSISPEMQHISPIRS